MLYVFYTRNMSSFHFATTGYLYQSYIFSDGNHYIDLIYCLQIIFDSKRKKIIIKIKLYKSDFEYLHVRFEKTYQKLCVTFLSHPI